jgi:hypothetical protein
MGSFEHRFDLWEQVEVAGSQVWRIGWVLKHSVVVISYKLLRGQSVMDWRIVLVQNPNVSPLFWTFPSHAFVKLRQDFKDILLIYRLVAGNPIRTYNTLHIEENNQYGLELRKTHACFFGLGDVADFLCNDCRFVSGSYVNIQVSPQVITELNKSGSSSTRCTRSKHSSSRRLFLFI